MPANMDTLSGCGIQQPLGQATEAAPQVSAVAAGLWQQCRQQVEEASQEDTPQPLSHQSGPSSANQETEVSEIAVGLWQQCRLQVEEVSQEHTPQPLSRESGVSTEGPAWA